MLAQELRSELLFHWYSRSVLVVVAFMVAGAGVAFAGSLSNAHAASDHFVSQVQLYEQNGTDIGAALAAPTAVTTGSDGSEVIENPLKYDYLRVGEAAQAVSSPGATFGTVLDLVTFFVIPMVFLFTGAYCALYDRRAGTHKLRGARTSWTTITAAKLLSVGVLAVAALAALGATSLVLSVLGRWRTQELLAGELSYELVEPTSVSPLAVKVLATLGVALLFGLVGFAVGQATSSTSWPMVAGAVFLFVLPFQGTWDPRNLMAAVSQQVFDFWGQFQMRPSLPVGTGTALAVLALYAVLALVLSVLLPRRSRRFR